MVSTALSKSACHEAAKFIFDCCSIFGKNFRREIKSKLQRAICDQKRKSPPKNVPSPSAIFKGNEDRNLMASAGLRQNPSTCQGWRYCDELLVSSLLIVAECTGDIETIAVLLTITWVGRAIICEVLGKLISLLGRDLRVRRLDKVVTVSVLACWSNLGILILSDRIHSNNSIGVIANGCSDNSKISAGVEAA